MDADGWESGNAICSGTFYPVTRSADPYPVGIGSYSIRLENNTAQLGDYCGYGFTWGISFNATQIAPAFPVVGHPASLTGYYKWLPLGGDTMYINAVLFKNGIPIANGKMTATATVSNWTSFDIPISAYTSADSGLIILAAYHADDFFYFPHGNSVLYVDNLNFDNLIKAGVQELNAGEKIAVYPNPFSFETVLKTEHVMKDATLIVYNSLGQAVMQMNDLNGKEITFHRDDLQSGIYFIQLRQGNRAISMDKLVISPIMQK